MLDKKGIIPYNTPCCLANGGIAQLARAFGSYPECHLFESDCRYHLGAPEPKLGAPDFFGPLVKWLRHRPFTAVTWVRVPYGSPERRISQISVICVFSCTDAVTQRTGTEKWTDMPYSMPPVQPGLASADRDRYLQAVGKQSKRKDALPGACALVQQRNAQP